MNKKKLVGYVMSGALSVGVLSGIGSNVYAKTMSNSSDSNNTKQEQIQKIKAELKSKLAKIGVSLPEPTFKNSMLSNLDDTTKKKAQAILDKEKDGSLSHEEAQKQLDALGVNFTEHPGKGKFESPLDNLNAAAKKKAQAILDKEKDGSLSHEEAQKQLDALGVNFTEHPGSGKFEAILDSLDAATKKKAQAILNKEKEGALSHEEAQKQLEALGVKFPDHPRNRGNKELEKSLDKLDEKTKEKAQKLIDQAQEKIQKLDPKH